MKIEDVFPVSIFFIDCCPHFLPLAMVGNSAQKKEGQKFSLETKDVLERDGLP